MSRTTAEIEAAVAEQERRLADPVFAPRTAKSPDTRALASALVWFGRWALGKPARDEAEERAYAYLDGAAEAYFARQRDGLDPRPRRRSSGRGETDGSAKRGAR